MPPLQSIREFGRLYAYLKDHRLRALHTGSQRLTVRGADFAGEEFVHGIWHNFRFVGCRFPGSFWIDQAETANCSFEGCGFGPGHREPLYFGTVRQGTFSQCRFLGADLGIGHGSVSFEGCDFGPGGGRTITLLVGDGTLPLQPSMCRDWRHYIPARHIVFANCTIHHLFSPWCMAASLTIRDCAIGKLGLPNARLGSFTLNNNKIRTLGLEHGLALRHNLGGLG